MTFDEFADFVRSHARVSPKKRISPDAQFERDLGITGDDGSELLIATEKHFGVRLSSQKDGYRNTFRLAPNEYLFNSEGFGTVYAFTTFFTTSSVRAFTVGELYEAVDKALKAK